MFARYTFFEVATQKGYLMSVLADLLPRHWQREIVSPSDGTSFLCAAKRNLHDEEPTWMVSIGGRTNRESTQMWQERARREAIAEWEAFAKAEADRVAVLRAAQARYIDEQAAEAERQQRVADRVAAAALIGASAAVLAPEEAKVETPPAPKPAKTKGAKKQ